MLLTAVTMKNMAEAFKYGQKPPKTGKKITPIRYFLTEIGAVSGFGEVNCSVALAIPKQFAFWEKV